jgi:hypothetical protein
MLSSSPIFLKPQASKAYPLWLWKCPAAQVFPLLSKKEWGGVNNKMPMKEIDLRLSERY